MDNSTVSLLFLSLSIMLVGIVLAYKLDMSSFHKLPIGADAPHVVNMVVEIPQGSSNKYEYDHELEIFKLDRTLYSPMFYPFDYGWVPQTLAEDGDPLDILVITTQPTFPGCLIVARPLGVLMMRDDKGPDEKILSVAAADPRFRDIHRLSDLPSHSLKEIVHFFDIYKELEEKETNVLGWQDVETAYEVIERFRLDNKPTANISGGLEIVHG